jgi:acyl-coenzyme A thioesterase PaaI-like protein
MQGETGAAEPRYLPGYVNCFCCGQKNEAGLQLRFYFEDGYIKCQFLPEERFEGYSGNIHGGVLCALLDETMGWAPTYHFKRMCVTGKLEFRFLRPIPLNQKYICRAKMTGGNRHLWEAQGQVLDEAGNVYVEGQGLYIPSSDEETKKVVSYLTYYPKGERPFD